ncbi:hypothetical protein [Flavobacterium ardleyense]|uniref:hypothetical protein n=1 Tax=Flavobacterium ardleyense TaxID=2038737 RepID=UPI00298BED39|nr:hypothetical protein [Flavobacterium ardleyense]
MRNLIQILILIFTISSCKSQEIKVNYRNIEINIPGDPGPWIMHNNNFYCYFKTDNDRFSSGSHHQFYILGTDGQVKSQIEVPKKLQTFYYDLYIKNDTIFTTEYYDKNTFYLDQISNAWIETKKGVDLYYDDVEYSVFSRDFGEWGAVTWFKDKSTNQQYEISAAAPIVNKLKNSYYITTGKSILKIDDPKKLDLSIAPYNYKKAVLDGKFFREGSNSTNRAEILLKSKNEYDPNPIFSFTTSFVANDKLYHLYEDSLYNTIGEIKIDKLVPIYTLKSKIKPFHWYYDTRNPIQSNAYQTVQFRTDKDNIYGILEINRANVSVIYFNNLYHEPVFSEKEMNDWVKNIFEYYYSNFKELTLEQIEKVEKELNATDLTQKHKISNYLIEDKDVETPRIYRKVEADKLRLITMYYYSESDKKIELIEFEWMENRNKKLSINDLDASDISNERRNMIYKSKFNWLSKYLREKIGKPASTKANKNGVEIIWQKDNLSIILEYSKNDLDLTIFRH